MPSIECWWGCLLIKPSGLIALLVFSIMIIPRWWCGCCCWCCCCCCCCCCNSRLMEVVGAIDPIINSFSSYCFESIDSFISYWIQITEWYEFDLYLGRSVAEFPGEDVVVGVLPSVVFRLAFGFAAHSATTCASSAGRYGRTWWATFRFRSTDDSRTDAACLLVAIEDFWHTTVRDAQLTGDDTRTDSCRRQFNDLQADVIRKRTTVDEHSAELINSSLAYNI